MKNYLYTKRWLNVPRSKKKKRIKRKKLRIGLITIVVSYLLFRMFPVFSIANHKTITAESGIIEELVSSKAVIIKDEFVLKSETQGTVSLLKKEGEKVGKGTQVAKINRTESSPYSKELEEIDKQIELLKKTSDSKEMFSKDKAKAQDNIDIIIDELQNSILKGNYDNASIYKNTLLKSIDKQQLVTGQKNLMSQSIDSLLKRKESIMKNMEKTDIVSYSPKAGILSYELDGLEEIFSVNKINEYKLSNFRIIDGSKKNLAEEKEVKYGEPIYKIIDNFTWYAMTEVDAKDVDKLEEGKIVHVRINNDEKKIISRIVKIIKEKDKCLIILKFTDFLHEHYKERYIDIHIIKNTFEGLIIPNKSITEKDGIKGVYIKDISGIVKFRPVKILTSDDEHTIVSEGEGNSSQIELNVNGKIQKFTTIQMFDEIFVNGSKIKEGVILN